MNLVGGKQARRDRTVMVVFEFLLCERQERHKIVLYPEYLSCLFRESEAEGGREKRHL